MTRRAPVQARSRARVDAILDAADAVFLEMGFAQATTNHVAARAGTSIGSLYRFFPDKDALLVALAARYAARMQQIGRDVSPTAPSARTLREVVATGFDTFNTFLVANPGFQTLALNASHPGLRAVRADTDASMIQVIAASQASLTTPVDAADIQVIATVTNAVLSALQLLSLQGDGAWRARIAEEAKRLATAWLSERLGIPPDEPLDATRPRDALPAEDRGDHGLEVRPHR